MILLYHRVTYFKRMNSFAFSPALNLTRLVKGDKLLCPPCLCHALPLLLTIFIFLSGCANTKETVKVDLQPGQEKFQIAVLPIENFSGTTAALKEIRLLFINGLRARGINVLEEQALERFMAKYRVRYIGGIDGMIAEGFKKETGTEAVLITSLELYSNTVPPKMAMISRLVSTGNNPVILWIDGVGLAGDNSPGILGLGLIEDPKALLQRGLQTLQDSLTKYLSGKEDADSVKNAKRKFQPKIAYRSQIIDPDRRYTVAVAPFFNSSMRKYGGDIMVLHFVKELKKFQNFDIIEPGVVRQQFLALRLIMDEGVSLANADVLFDTLQADLIVSGKVLDYQDYQGGWGKPKVDFSVIVIEKKSREVVWSSTSYNEGDDGVFFFDHGRVNTAYVMASQMTRSIGERIIRGQGEKVVPEGVQRPSESRGP